MVAKTTRQILEMMNDDARFKRVHVESMREEVAEWCDTAAALAENLYDLAGLDTNIELNESLTGIAMPTSAGTVQPLAAVAEAIQTLEGAREYAEDAKTALDNLTQQWAAMEDPTETWLDECSEKDDRAAARETMCSIAADILDTLADLEALGIDIENITA